MCNMIEELYKKRFTCRSFNQKNIKAEDIIEIARLASLAPSACNSQPWKMYVITDKEAVKKTAEALQDNGKNGYVSKCKAFIAIAETEAVLNKSSAIKFDSSHFVKYDVGELIAYITLAATDKNIASCIIGWTNQQKLNEILALHSNEYCPVVIGFGYTDFTPPSKIRKNTEDTIKII